jgi:DMSO/TMAO reductase YedYZ heme-binding membrane subunit
VKGFDNPILPGQEHFSLSTRTQTQDHGEYSGLTSARNAPIALPRPTVKAMPAQVVSVVWWHVARASGLIAWALLGASVVGGLLLATQPTRGRKRRATQGLHEFLGPLAVVFTAIHMISVLASAQLQVGFRGLLVPFARPGNPVGQACGVLAFYLLTAVMLTSFLRAHLSWRWWRRLHRLAFPLFGLA